MLTLQEEFSSLMVGPPSHFRNLTVFPLIKPENVIETDYLLLDDAISNGLVHVTELRVGATVSELALENQAEKPVLMLNGEELVGAKQNRLLNITILAPAKYAMPIPVSCVEARRWHMETPNFQPGGHVMYSEARAEQVLQVTGSMRTSGKHTSDQAAVWRNIAGKAVRLKTVSPTGAVSDIYRFHASSVDKFVRAFSWKEHQCGAALGIAGRIVGIDILDCPNTMKRLFAKLIRSYALDALDDSLDVCDAAKSEDLDAFIAKVAQAQTFSDKALGLGKDVRFDADEITGAALWANGRSYTFVAFVGQESNPHRRSKRQVYRVLGRFS